jgi:hypothetical protein
MQKETEIWRKKLEPVVLLENIEVLADTVSYYNQKRHG